MIPPPALPARHRWPVELAAGPLRLRPLRRRDERAWQEVRARNWGWLRRWEPTAPPESQGEVLSYRRLVASLDQQAREDRALPFALWCDGPAGWRLIGQVTATGITLGSARFGQVGYWIDRAYAGRGIMPFAVAFVCDYLFFTLALHRVEICIRPENAPSLRVVDKLGFREEGPRPAYLHIDGAWRDHRVFALHRDEVGQGLLSRCPAPRLDGLGGREA